MEAAQGSIDKLTDKQNVGYTHNGIVSSQKKKEILTHAATGMNLGDMLSEISWSQKDKYYVILHMKYVG